MPDSFDHSALSAAWGGCAPAGASREERVRWFGECGRRLLASREPGDVFVGSAILAVLEHGGRLEDYLRLNLPGSHLRPHDLWRRLSSREEDSDGARVLQSRETDSESDQ
jgi:hypothetical protein